MEEEIDELGDLKVVDSDRWLVLGGNDQVLLLGSFAELHVPCGYAVDAAAGENRVYQIGFNQVRLAEVRPAEVRPAEVRLAEVRPAEVRLAEVRPVRFASLRFALLRSAPLRFAPPRFASLRSAPRGSPR